MRKFATTGLGLIIVLAGCRCASNGGTSPPPPSGGDTPTTSRFTLTVDDAPGMGREFDAPRSFEIDLGRTFESDRITMVHVWIDTSRLSYDAYACENGVPDSCDDELEIKAVDRWRRATGSGRSNSKAGQHDVGEHRYFDASRNADKIRVAAEAVADGRLTIAVHPVAKDDCIVHSVYVEVVSESAGH